MAVKSEVRGTLRGRLRGAYLCPILNIWYNTRQMQHRHLQSDFPLSAAAIDDIINRGGREDWAFLRDSSRNDSSVMAKIRRVCAPHNSDPYDQKYHLWALYAG